MDVFKGKVIGIGKGVSKKNGKPFTMLHVAGKPFTSNQISNGCVGAQVATYFVDESMKEKIDISLIGKEATISAVFAGGNDILCDIKL